MQFDDDEENRNTMLIKFIDLAEYDSEEESLCKLSSKYGVYRRITKSVML